MDVPTKTIKDGLVFDDGDMRVTALHNEYVGVLKKWNLELVFVFY